MMITDDVRNPCASDDVHEEGADSAHQLTLSTTNTLTSCYFVHSTSRTNVHQVHKDCRMVQGMLMCVPQSPPKTRPAWFQFI